MKTAEQILDLYYLDTRCMLVEIAAMLDRHKRASDGTFENNGNAEVDDARAAQIYEALKYLANSQDDENRSENLLNMFSDLD